MPPTRDVLYVRPPAGGEEESWGQDSDSHVQVTSVPTGAAAVAQLREATFDGVICEYDLGSEETGLDVLRAIRDHDGTLPVLLCSDETDGEVAIDATRAGVTEYVSRARLDQTGESLADRFIHMLDAHDSMTSSGGIEMRTPLSRS